MAMIAVVGGLGAALMWAVSTVSSSRSSRLIGSASVVGWVMAVGLVVLIPGLVATGVPAGLDAQTLGWLVLVGAGNILGLLLVYAALRIGKVGIVAPITSTEGAIAATIALLLGERISPGSGFTLAAIAVGVVLAGLNQSDPLEDIAADRTRLRTERRAALLSISAALMFGIGLYAAGRVSSTVPVAWVLLPARALGTFALAVPLAISGRLRLSRRAAPFVVLSGVCEIVGTGSFVLGAQHGIAITAVLSSQFAAIAAVAAFVLFRERLVRVQVAGVLTILGGVALLSYLQA